MKSFYSILFHSVKYTPPILALVSTDIYSAAYKKHLIILARLSMIVACICLCVRIGTVQHMYINNLK